ncbi:MAG: hypothetical protein BZY87_02070 [SAR202 cluster bacterium Io17-Chloro-G6]|nr:MAG: hypothetical protein BZY87_02070 [SAR202 cluster bacterium Io17-Chloro-G6]
MTIVSLADELGLATFNKSIFEGFPAEQEDSIRAASSYLADQFRKGTVAAEDIDSFIDETLDLLPRSKQPEVLAYLIAKKGTLLCQAGAIDAGLKHYDEALEVKETPSTWALKGAVLLQVPRLDDAFGAFQKAFELRREFGDQKQAYLNDLIFGWSTGALLRGLFGILEQNISEAQKGAEEYINISSKAHAEGLEASLLPLEVDRSVSKDLIDAMEELKLMVRLLSIKDPFEGWRELSKEVGKVWPEDMSAVDAIREQRT